MIENFQYSERFNRQTTCIATGLNVVFCLVVAALITVSGSAQSLWQNIQIAFGFGLSVQVSLMLLARLCGHSIRPVYWAAAILAGLLAGSAWAQYVLIKSKTIPVVDWSITFEVFLSGVGFTAVALGIHYNYLRQTRIREKLWQAEKQQLEHSRELAQSELKALQAQIEPHFLFNSLASIRALIAVEPVMAERMLDHLSVLLRGVLQRSRSGSTSLAHELTLVKAYLDIQQIRLGSRLQYRIEAPDALTMDIEFPVLMLQPLVENAVGHGIEPAIEGGEVSVVVSIRQKTCTVVIEDTGVGLARDGRKGQGMALENVRARLDVLHGEGASLLVEPRLPQGTRCVLEVPVEQH